MAQRLITGAVLLPQAQQMRDQLTAAGLPSEQILLVGRDCTPAYPGSGHRSTVAAASRGAVPGLIVGALVGVVLRVTGLVEPQVSQGWVVFAATLLGSAAGAIISVLAHGLTARRRAASRESTMRIGRFDLLVDADLADRAVRLLEHSGSGHSSAREQENDGSGT